MVSLVLSMPFLVQMFLMTEVEKWHSAGLNDGLVSHYEDNLITNNNWQAYLTGGASAGPAYP